MGFRSHKLILVIAFLLFGFDLVLFLPIFPISIDYSGSPINGTGQPTKIAAQTVPTLVNGITTTTSIVIAIGAVMFGIISSDITKSHPKTKETIFSLLGFLLIPIGYLFFAYCLLALGWFEWALRWSMGGFLIAIFVILSFYLVNDEILKSLSPPAATDKP